jgi:hypothetical protein
MAPAAHACRAVFVQLLFWLLLEMGNAVVRGQQWVLQDTWWEFSWVCNNPFSLLFHVGSRQNRALVAENARTLVRSPFLGAGPHRAGLSLRRARSGDGYPPGGALVRAYV